MAADHWVVRLTATAEADYRQILQWTLANFGQVQTRTCAVTLSAALKALSAGPAIPGVRERDEIGAQVRMLHFARMGRKGRHFVVFRVDDATGRKVIEVLRLLQDAMDLARHFPPDTLRGRDS